MSKLEEFVSLQNEAAWIVCSLGTSQSAISPFQNEIEKLVWIRPVTERLFQIAIRRFCALPPSIPSNVNKSILD
jgi:hypothetical protein